MPKKTVQKLEVVEIKTYKCSDGSVYDTEEAALSHEQFLKDCDDNPLLASKIKELESRILALEAENATLSARIQYLESKNTFPWRQPNPDVSPWGPYQNPQNPITSTPKLPSEPGNVVYDAVELSKLSDEELIKKGYNVAYCGHKRAIIPPFENPLDKKVEINIDSVRGNATTPPDATPLEACSHGVYNTLSYPDSQTVKDFKEWLKKANKK